MSFEGKVIIVTGASRGIGRAIALKFGAEKAKIALNYCSNHQAAGETAKIITESGGEALLIQADISQRAECEKIVDHVVNKWNSVDVLVNNAGITRDGLLMSMQDSDWEKVITTNLEGTVFLSKAVLPYMMMQKKGRIINISSVSAENGRRGQASYSASKGAVNSFTKVLALEVAQKGITVNAIAPGMIETDMSDLVRGMASKQILAQIPIGRFGNPEEIAQLAMFLASDQASYITGQIIKIDGGITLGIGI